MHVKASDLRGYARLALDATLGVTGVVEGMHRNIAKVPLMFAGPVAAPVNGIADLVYASIRAIGTGVVAGIDAGLAIAGPLIDKAIGEAPSSYVREGLMALFNGLVGDHLEATGNPLAIQMSIRHEGQALVLDPCAIAQAIPTANHRLVVMAHGLCMNDLEFLREGHDHGKALTRDLDATTLYLHYNSGRHISQNGREFADKLEALVQAWPMGVEELVLVGFSMGGLVSRSACHYGALAGHSWVRKLKRIVFIGTPHHGAPLERHGNKLQWLAGITPYTAPLGRLGALRSAGITDLRHGSLLDEDWQGCDRFEHHEDRRTPVPLPAGVRCYTVAASTGGSADDLSDKFLGDGIVFLDSALGRHADARHALVFGNDDTWTAWNTTHLGMLNSAEIYARVRTWLQQR